jgi:hypothetical protein
LKALTGRDAEPNAAAWGKTLGLINVKQQN